ncbi:helicase HerA domain-containing protein, partial [Stenotrophomonas maltophilia]|uniref:helicase HerA domain-containing protein n=1 Tax=Stenotrophomonas maltophilia TaxID=40324 RepID=UPI001954834D
IHYEPARLINAHMLICGMSGTGKSFQCRGFLESAAAAGVEIDIFDVHEELSDIRGSTTVKYSQATGYGFNPLVLNTDLHSG